MFGMAQDFLLAAQGSHSSGGRRATESLAAFLRCSRSEIAPNASHLGNYERLPKRVGKPVTQEEVAEALGVTRTWYGKLETRRAARPSLTLLQRIASTLMLKPSERAQLFNLAIRDGEELIAG